MAATPWCALGVQIIPPGARQRVRGAFDRLPGARQCARVRSIFQARSLHNQGGRAKRKRHDPCEGRSFQSRRFGIGTVMNGSGAIEFFSVRIVYIQMIALQIMIETICLIFF